MFSYLRSLPTWRPAARAWSRRRPRERAHDVGRSCAGRRDARRRVPSVLQPWALSGKAMNRRGIRKRRRKSHGEAGSGPWRTSSRSAGTCPAAEEVRSRTQASSPGTGRAGDSPGTGSPGRAQSETPQGVGAEAGIHLRRHPVLGAAAADPAGRTRTL